MWEDPIVAEVHRIREQLAAADNYDVKTMFAEIRKREIERGRETGEWVRQSRTIESRWASFRNRYSCRNQSSENTRQSRRSVRATIEREW